MVRPKTKSTAQPVGAVMVVGGGIAGMQASLDLAEQGFKVYLVESNSAIGGKVKSQVPSHVVEEIIAQSKREAEEDELRQKRAAERDALAAKRGDTEEVQVSVTAADLQLSDTDKIIATLNWVHRRNT